MSLKEWGLGPKLNCGQMGLRDEYYMFVNNWIAKWARMEPPCFQERCYLRWGEMFYHCQRMNREVFWDFCFAFSFHIGSLWLRSLFIFLIHLDWLVNDFQKTICFWEDCRCMLLCLEFRWVMGIWTQIVMAVQQIRTDWAISLTKWYD